MHLPLAVLAALAALCAAPAPVAAPSPLPFFAYCMDTHDSLKRTLPEQAALLKELGYDGAGHLWLDNVQERLKTLDTAGLKLFQITMQVSMKDGTPPYDREKLEAVLPLLKGRGVQLCLLMQGMPPSDPAGDGRGVDIVREIADLAKASGTEVLLYPHANDWMEKVSDAVRIAEKADRPNVGVMFNLCHWLKVDQEENLRPVLESALPRLRAVSINGADRAEAIHAGTGDWLQPLDKGSYDVSQVLRTLAELGYKGPVGLQCYGIGGDARDHLTRSMAAWKRLNGGPARASATGDGNS